MRLRALVRAAFLTLVMPAAALANDSTAELTTGGLVLTKSADIEMRSEDLSISEKRIQVRYAFFNRGPVDVSAVVAFPMPDIVWGGYDDTIAVPDWNSANFLDFSVSVDGRAVATEYEQKAIGVAGDASARLRGLGIPLAPQSEATQKALDALPRPVQEQLIKEELAVPNDYDVGKGTEHHVAPHWTLKTTFFWRQTFPAGRDLIVDHAYTPSVGGTVGSILNSRSPEPVRMRDYQTRYCLDGAFLAGVQAARGKLSADGFATTPLYEYRLAYILKTGANWAGPIGDFHLTVDKGSPDSLISFCADGVRKTGPTRFEVHQSNFTPRSDLDILILRRPKT